MCASPGMGRNDARDLQHGTLGGAALRQSSDSGDLRLLDRVNVETASFVAADADVGSCPGLVGGGQGLLQLAAAAEHLGQRWRGSNAIEVCERTRRYRVVDDNSRI